MNRNSWKGLYQSTPFGNIEVEWQEFNGHSYYINQDNSYSYGEAKQFCEDISSHLVIIHSEAENAFLKELAISGPSHLWIGLDDIDVEGHMKWEDGSLVTYSDWNSGEPNNRGEEDCGHLRSSDGKWNDLTCTYKNGFICEQEDLLECDYLNEKAYYVNQDRSYTYDQAKHFCEDMGSHLVIINDDEENSFLKGLAIAGESHLWIGLDDTDVEGEMKWADNSLVTYSDWIGAEPNNGGGNEDCAHLRSSDGKWNDMSCSNKNGFICEDGPLLQWQNSNGVSYYINQDSSYTYDEAKQFCEDMSTHLVIINSDEENTYLKDLAIAGESHLWIGLDDITVEGEMKWADNSLMTYSDWRSGEPNNSGGNEDCGHLRRGDGKWNDMSCSENNGFICEKGPLLQWQNSNGVSYYINQDSSYTYDEAKQFCEDMSTHLVIIDDDEENTYLKDLAIAGRSHLWIGLDDITVEGEMKWADNSLVTYSDWFGREPNNGGGNEDCGHLRSSDGKWNDMACTRKFGFICEKGPLLQWNNFNGNNYFVNYAKQYTYGEATQFCDSVSSHLVIIDNDEENTYLKDLAIAGGSQLWIGLDDIDVEGEMKWADDSRMTYSGWKKGEPNNFGGNEDCGNIRPADGTWNDMSCSKHNGFICEKGPLLQWKNFNGNSYHIKDDNIYTYDEARQFCEDISSHLAVIDNDEENTYLKDLAIASVRHLWIGLDDIDVEGEMKWVDGSQVTYSDWYGREPNNGGGNEDCGHLRSSDGKWNDMACSKKNGFICEKD
ncbi:macrophage mannose receptor 1-like [Glandiceps talaboti]